MGKVRLLRGKPLMVGGRVALSDGCCCGGSGAGACCVDGVCSSKTEADCNALGGKFLPGQSCDPNPCICPNPNKPTITLTYSGVEQCFPDDTVFPPAPFPNGIFTLGNTSPGNWAVRVRWCRNTDTNEWHTAVGDECEAGEDTLDIDYSVICVDGTLTIADFGFNFFQAVGTMPTLNNSINCPAGFGGSGTATVTP